MQGSESSPHIGDCTMLLEENPVLEEMNASDTVQSLLLLTPPQVNAVTESKHTPQYPDL